MGLERKGGTATTTPNSICLNSFVFTMELSLDSSHLLLILNKEDNRFCTGGQVGRRVSNARPKRVAMAVRSITSLAAVSSCSVNPAFTQINVAGIIPREMLSVVVEEEETGRGE